MEAIQLGCAIATGILSILTLACMLLSDFKTGVTKYCAITWFLGALTGLTVFTYLNISKDIEEASKPQAIDVYRGNTCLEINYKWKTVNDSTIESELDSTVIWCYKYNLTNSDTIIVK